MVLVPCSICKSKFSNICSLHTHYKHLHKNIVIQKYDCGTEGCSRKFDLWNSLRKHLVRDHQCPLRDCVEPNDVSNIHNPSEASRNLDFDDIEDCETSCDPILSIDDFRNTLKETASVFVCKILSKPGLPRCLVDILIKDVACFLSEVVNLIQLLVSKYQSDIPEELKSDLDLAISALETPFQHLSTEYKRFKFFENSGEFIRPVTYEIGRRPEKVSTKDGPKWVMKSVTAQFIPVGEVLENLLALPDALESSLAYVKSLESETGTMSSFLQGEVWQRKRSKYDVDDIVLPLMVYYDDFEPNNPLGPHCEKLGAVYLQLPFLPPECQGKLENIILAILFNADDRAACTNERVFRPLVNELISLETNGIIINTGKEQLKIYFVAGSVLGDNLGLNGACGFVECFSSNFMCRICKVSKEVLHTLFVEDINLLRSHEDYLADVKANSPSSTGVKELCVFEKIPSFETPGDISVDCFHDTDEGVSHYVMVPVLLHFHAINKDFIETLNNRLYMVNLGPESDNRPPSICIEKIKDKKKIKMTGKEMQIFVRLFGTLVIDMVPENDPFYHMYLLLNDIVSIVHANILPRNINVVLAVHIEELNRLYTELTKENLKFKFHVLLHYPNLTQKLGPPGCLTTIRLEAKHKFLKTVTNVCFSRKNLPKTVATKCQLNLCFRFRCNQSILPPLILGSGEVLDLRDHENFYLFRETLPPQALESTSVYCSQWAEFKGTKYKVKDIVISSYSDEGCPNFSEIDIIFVCENNLFFVCSSLYTLGYYSEARAYEVEKIPDNAVFSCVNPKDLFDPFPLALHQTGKGELVITVKSFL